MKQYNHKTYPTNNNNIVYDINMIQQPEIIKDEKGYLNQINNEAYYTDPKTGKKILYDDIPSEKFDSVETYYMDPNTGKEIKIIENKNTNNTKEKFKNKSYIGNANYNNLYQQPQILKNAKPQPINKKEQGNNIYETTLSPVIDILTQLDLNATILPTQNDLNEFYNNSIIQHNQYKDISPTASTLSVSTLSNIEYRNYPEAKKSFRPFANIAGFGLNSYNGKKKNFNEDRISAFPDKIIQKDNKNYYVSYFSIFDGHSGNKCSDFLRKNFSSYLFNSPFFPKEPLKAIDEAFQKAENDFYKMAYDPKIKKLIDKSGSCALIMLIVDNLLYAINLGDSRALYSYDTGKHLLQITRDHKPDDKVEKERIEKCGGSIYYANTIHRNGKEIELKEEDFGPNFKFPYRIKPGGLAVSIIFFHYLIQVVRTIGDFYAKIPHLGGLVNAVSSRPCVNILRADEKSDFLIMGCDGIYDRLDNDQILKKIWEYKKRGKVINDIHSFCAQITDGIIKYSMEKNSVDNVSVVFIAFKNFENKMKEPNFEFNYTGNCKPIEKDKIDFTLINNVNVQAQK